MSKNLSKVPVYIQVHVSYKLALKFSELIDA